jgi:peptidoglycan hydrolase CwlO-like protein
MEKSGKNNIDKFLNQLNLKQLNKLQKKIDERKSRINSTNPEIEELRRLFLPKNKL